MKEIFQNLYVGNQIDFANGSFSDDFSFLLAAKEPFHRSAIGYKGRALDKTHPEYLKAYRENKLILNLVDAPKSIFFDKGLIDSALDFIGEELGKDRKVLIVCNEGRSRSASIGLLWLLKEGHIKGDTLEDVEAEYMKLYPNYNPGKGIRDFVKENFAYYKT